MAVFLGLGLRSFLLAATLYFSPSQASMSVPYVPQVEMAVLPSERQYGALPGQCLGSLHTGSAASLKPGPELLALRLLLLPPSSHLAVGDDICK